MACDLAKTFLTAGRHGPLKRFRVMALTDNVPLLTALANDVSYDAVFAEQLRNLADEGDLLIVISGSGNSPNVLEAVRAAKECGLRCVGLLGSDGGAVRELLDHCVIVDSDDYGQIEDVHMVLNHICAASLKRP
jgi:D-sedoheptulose 7-phosphate isomerase